MNPVVRTLRASVVATWLSAISLPRRLLSCLVTLIGVAVAVAVLTALMSMGAGLRALSGDTTDTSRVIVMPRNVVGEFAGSISADEISLIRQSDAVARDRGGEPLIQPNALVWAEATRRRNGAVADILLRGTGATGLKMNPGLKLVAGRMFQPGRRELIVGEGAQRELQGLDPGQTVKLGVSEWRVVGVFRDEDGMLENNLLADIDTVRTTFNRQDFQSVDVQLVSRKALDGFNADLQTRFRTQLVATGRAEYYASQVAQFARTLDIVSYAIGAIMGVGATLAAITALYVAVTARAAEFATLRVIGFPLPALMCSVVAEAVLVAVCGAALGALAATIAIDGRQISAGAFIFRMAVTPPVLLTASAFALLMGLLGGLIPALQGNRLDTATAAKA